jgi:hypothetical protein
MAIGRISGAMLSSNLDRQGAPLTFVSGLDTLMHLDFSGSKVGINTDIVSETLTVNGKIGTIDGEGSGFLVNGTTISAKNGRILNIGSEIDLGFIGTVYLNGGNNLDVVTTDGNGNLTWQSANVWLANSNFLQNVTISGSTISTSVANSNLVLQGNGSGEVTSPLMLVTNLTATNLTSNNINGSLTGTFAGSATGTFAGNVLTAAQPFITSLGIVTGLTSSGNINAPVVNASLHGDVYTDNIYGIDGNLTIHTQPGTVLTIDSTAAQRLPIGTTVQRPTGPLGSFRYNTDANAPEYFNGFAWISMRSEIATQTILGNDASDTFYLVHSATQDSVIVSINGTIQQPGVAYAIDPQSSNYILFTEVPKSGDTIEVRFLTTSPMVEMAQQNSLAVNSPTVSYGTSPVVIDEFKMTDFRSAKYTITAQAANGDLTMSEVMVMHNGITSTVTETVTVSTIFSAGTPPTVITSSTGIITYTTTVAAGSVRLLAQSALSGASLKLYKLYFPV